MGIVSREIIDRVRDNLDIVEVIKSYIPVTMAGRNAKALCPFHKEKTPSFHINAQRGMFHCFGCGKGGDVFRFVMEFENVDFPTALRTLAARAGVAIPEEEEERGARRSGAPTREELYKANAAASERFQAALRGAGEEAAAARAYLAGRKLGESLWKAWGIGYAPDEWGFLTRGEGGAGPLAGESVLEAAGLAVRKEDESGRKGTAYDRFRGRVMFSIRNELGKTVGFSGRLLKEEEGRGGKYVNTPETEIFKKSKVLFGLDKAKRGILDAKEAVLCEGQIDCIRCHEAGFANVVASQGTAFTELHARLLKRYTDQVTVVLDGDNAGRKAALRTAELLLDEGLGVELATLPTGEDPDSLILKEGAEGFRRVLAGKASPIRFLGDWMREEMDLRLPRNLLRAQKGMAELASHVPGEVLREAYLREASQLLGVEFLRLQKDFRALEQGKRGGWETPAERAERERPAEAASAAPAAHEEELAVLLAGTKNPAVAALCQEWIRYPLIRHAGCRAVIQALVEEGESWVEALDGEPEEVRALAAKIANTELRTKSETGDELAAVDYILKIWTAELESRAAEARRRMSEDGEDRRAWMEKRLALTEGIRQLKAADREAFLAGGGAAPALREWVEKFDGGE